MSRSNWPHQIAVRGFLIAILSVPLDGLAQEDKPQDQREAGQSRDAKEQANPSPFGIRIRIEREEQKKEPDWNSPKCDQPQTHDEADLCEQRRMSNAAEDALVLNEIQTGLGIAGALLLFFTLIATIVATWKAAIAANAAVDQARIMRNADCPYMIPRTPELSNFREVFEDDAFGLPFGIHIKLENIGKSPAFVDSYGIAREICIEGREGRTPIVIRSDFARLPITSGGIWTPGAALEYFALSADEKVALVRRDKILFFYEYFRYSDIYRVFRRTGFMFEYIIDGSNGTFIMRHSADWWYDIEEPTPKKRHWYQRKTA